ncbi:DEAD/DEAH box helicase [Candidatus Peregrinibacteria bacterium CG_4_10_14_0_2_um_filter_43_11]|nr:MAG: DEAD/DEAH box helicase [Candidatus Peregrinibacteria bacterium CG_4_10_14_0_2_um_filter_43_11]
MKLQFEANQQYQLDAINAIVEAFEGQSLESGDFEVEMAPPADQLQMGNELLIGNRLELQEESILKNVQTIQRRFNETHERTNAETGEKFGGIEVSDVLDGMNFSVEMETGTGKTYTYIRTIHELTRKYGFKKFVIVVPSIAIKEGTIKNLEITREHFAMLYNNPKMDFYVYDPKKRGQLKNFATTNALQILVINIDSFAKKDSNIIYQESDWDVPVEYIKTVKPIVIVDEPQNMETDIRKQAIANLNPLCTLRYSATHKHPYNLLYKLDPVRAYDLGLVKKIEVDSIFSEDAYSDAYIRVVKFVRKGKGKIGVQLEIDKSDDYGLQKKTITMEPGDDLFELSGKREVYDGFMLENIYSADGYIEFSNGKTFYLGQKDEGLHEDIIKYQIKKTVENHFEKEAKLKEKGIKVLSLIFIDRVANYREYSESGFVKGKFAQWFEEAYAEMQTKPKFKGVLEHSAEEVHNGYFSADKKTGQWKDSTDTKGEGGKTKDDEQTYELIMKEKEKLLDAKTPLRFIFSHSALREGWDNPNVFQICTLNETRSDMKKRQEIGRGLRLPVDQNGTRVFDQNINILTVIANESYEDFARSLQNEIEEDCGVSFTGRIKNKKARKAVQLKKGYQLDSNFKDLWERIKHRTRYSVDYDTEMLVCESVKLLREITVVRPKISNVRVRIEMDEKGLGTEVIISSGKTIDADRPLSIIPDVVSGIQGRTKLTKSTIYQMLKDSGQLSSLLVNPQQLLDEASLAINQALKKMMVDGIKYEKIAGETWEMQRFENEELEGYLDKLVEVKNQDKTLYDHILVDSVGVEGRFAKDLESREDVKFYIKLPWWFKIDTPIGGYNPDWAIVFEGDKRIYFVAETKSVGEIRESEQMRITCGKAHFEQLDEVRFERVEKLEEIVI